MKAYFISIIALLTQALSSAQTDLPFNKETGMVEYSEVVEVAGSSADKLFSTAKIFIASEATSAKDVIQMIDESSKTVVVKGAINVSEMGSIHLSLTISCKENKYKYIITEIVHYYTPGQQFVKTPIESDRTYIPFVSKKLWGKMRQSMDLSVKDYIKSVKSAMRKDTSNW